MVSIPRLIVYSCIYIPGPSTFQCATLKGPSLPRNEATTVLCCNKLVYDLRNDTHKFEILCCTHVYNIIAFAIMTQRGRLLLYSCYVMWLTNCETMLFVNVTIHTKVVHELQKLMVFPTLCRREGESSTQSHDIVKGLYI